MRLLDPTFIRDICDYSFGDQSGQNLFGGYMKPANKDNQEFMDKYKRLVNVKPYMTLFIDNFRLYKRDGIKYTAMEQIYPSAKMHKDKAIVEYFKYNDLLELCSMLTDMNFLIFTGFEDTPTDEFIYDKIPDNVIGIYASNAITFGGKVHAYPYGIQRRLYASDFRQEVLMNTIPIEESISNLLYVNYSLGTNPERVKINEYLSDKSWVTISAPTSIEPDEYSKYLKNIKHHKFVICPSGNAIGCECHRDWETLYMRRVPIVKRSEYLIEIFGSMPVLMVDSFFDITEKLLIENDHIYQEALKFDVNRLDIEIIYDKIIDKVNKSL